MFLTGALALTILPSLSYQATATHQGNDLRGRTNDDPRTVPFKDQYATIISMDKTLSGDTLPIMTGTDKTVVEPGIPTMQPSFSSVSGTWSDSFIPAKDKTPRLTPTSSMPAKDQLSASALSTDHAASSLAPAEDQTTKPSNLEKDLTASTSNQVYGFSRPTSAKDDKTYSKPQTSASSGKLTGSTSSTVPVVVTYSFTMPPSSSADSGKPETSLSVMVSSFTMPSIIYSFTVQSSMSETAASTPSVGPFQSKSEKSDSTIKPGQLPGVKGSSTRIGKPYYTATSSMVPLWTPEMLGNAYGGGFVNAPSIYVTLSPNPTATATGVPPGYGFTVEPEISDKSSSSYSGFLGMSIDKIRLGGPPSTQMILVSGFGPSYTTDEYGIPTSGTSSTTDSTDCCSASTTLSTGQIDSFGIPASVPESYPTSYTFSEMYPIPITTAPYRNNATLSAGSGSSNSNRALVNPTALPEFRGFAVKNTMGLTAGILGILVFVLLV